MSTKTPADNIGAADIMVMMMMMMVTMIIVKNMVMMMMDKLFVTRGIHRDLR